VREYSGVARVGTLKKCFVDFLASSILTTDELTKHKEIKKSNKEIKKSNKEIKKSNKEIKKRD
jgi:peptidoglycan hydrolase CwlO-like protein